MCLPMNQMSILHAHGNQLAFLSALLRAKSINSKHRWPGWPTSVFLVCLTVFNAFRMVISMVSWKKSSNSSAVTTASKMCRDRCCTMVPKDKRLHSNIFPVLSFSKQRNSLHKDTFFLQWNTMFLRRSRSILLSALCFTCLDDQIFRTSQPNSRVVYQSLNKL